MDAYGDRVLRAAVNVVHTRGQEGRDWLARAVLVAAGELDHSQLDPPEATLDESPSPRPRWRLAARH